jgi:hypothetical protein
VIIFFSGDGGARTAIPETELVKPAVMLSYYHNVKNGEPDQRFKAMIRARKWHTKQGTDMDLYFSGYSHGKSLPERAMRDVNDGKGPCIMLTHHEIRTKACDTVNRFMRHVTRRNGEPVYNKDGSKRPVERIWKHFLDSGAHSLYNTEVLGKRYLEKMTPRQYKKYMELNATQRSAFKREAPWMFATTQKERYKYFESDHFWDCVDQYANFVKEYKVGIDFYANLDVIHHPEFTWKVQQYLEDFHKLNPVPVIHHGEPLEWIDHYLRYGYDLIAIGGVSQEQTAANKDYISWVTQIYDKLCPKSNKRKPIVRTHGFAVTDYHLLTWFPWWSVDSSTWVKAGGFGLIHIPHKRQGKFVFDEKPYSISTSGLSPRIKQRGKHLNTLPKETQKIVHEWLEYIDVPIGSFETRMIHDKRNLRMKEELECIEWGVTSHHGARKIANLRFFKMLEESLPEWPWPFTPQRKERPGFLP